MRTRDDLASSAEVTDDRIRALIKLLGDEDTQIRKIAQRELLQLGSVVTGPLADIVHRDADGVTRIYAGTLLNRIRRKELIRAFHALAIWPDDLIDLEQGAYLLARVAHPDLARDEISLALDRMAEQVRLQLPAASSGRKIVRAINSVLYAQAGFRGNTENYYAIDNSCLNRVLEQRKGIPITLSLIYILLAQRLQVPIFGINTPMHFLCMYDDGNDRFFIDAFERGRILSYADCIVRIRRYGIEFHHQYLVRASHRDILSRMLRNLILIYYNNKEERKANFLRRLLRILKYYTSTDEPF